MRVYWISDAARAVYEFPDEDYHALYLTCRNAFLPGIERRARSFHFELRDVRKLYESTFGQFLEEEYPWFFRCRDRLREMEKLAQAMMRIDHYARVVMEDVPIEKLKKLYPKRKITDAVGLGAPLAGEEPETG